MSGELLSDDEWLRDDPREWFDEATPCTGCGQPTLIGEVAGGVVIGWCDLCWQRCIVRWKRWMVDQRRRIA